jgi:hypothetical protein
MPDCGPYPALQGSITHLAKLALSGALATVQRMTAKRAIPDPDVVVTARLQGTASRHTRRDPLDAAVAELPEIAGGRSDLLGEVAVAICSARWPGGPSVSGQEWAAKWARRCGHAKQ